MINNITFLNGFAEYLRETQGDKYSDESISDVSIFSFSSELKDYMINELGANLDIKSKNIDEIINMSFENGKLIEQSDLDDSGSNSGEFSVVNIINSIFQDENVVNALDTDKTGDISQEEILSFLDNIKSSDGDDSDISLTDIFNGLSSLGGTIDEENETVEESNVTDNIKSSHKPAKGNKKDSGDNDIDKNANKSYSEMNASELSNELTKENNTLNENKKALNNILNGSDSTMSSLKDTMDSAYEEYQQELKNVDVEMAEQLDTITSNLQAEESNHNSLERDCADKKTELNNCETEYSNAKNRLSTLKATESKLSSSKSGETEAEKQKRESSLSKIRSEISAAEAKVKQAEEDKIAAKSALEEAEANKSASESRINEIEQERDTFEAEIAKKYPEIQVLQQNYETSKTEYEKYKTENVSKLKSNIEIAESNIKKISTEQGNISNKKEALGYTMLACYDSEMGQKLALEAIKVAQNSDDSVGCGRGVRYALENLGYEGIERCKGKDWAETNLEGRDDFIEITEEISLEDIKNGNVPVGSIVCFSEYDSFGYGSGNSGHVAIVVDYNGTICEASNYIRKAGINTNIIEKGNGEYRIFMPCK